MDSRDPNDVIGEPQVAASAADKPHNRTVHAFTPTDCTQEALLNAYDTDGQGGVYHHVDREHPDWEWALCVPCEDTTPTWDGVCAVCWSAR